MSNGLRKAFLLELRQIKASKANLVFLFLMPFLFVAVLAAVGSAALPEGLAGKYFLDKGTRFFDFYAPPLLATLIFFITAQTTVLRIVGERAPYGTLDRDLLAISRARMYLGKFFANVLIAFFQCLVILATTLFVFNALNRGNPVTAFVLLFLTAILGLSFGLLASVLASSKEEAVQYIPITALVFFVMSGFVVSLDQMPVWMKAIAENTPIALSGSALANVMLAGATLSAVFAKALYLVYWTAALLLLGVTKFWLEYKVKIE